MYEEKIAAYFDDPRVERQLVEAVARLVKVKSVRGEAQEGAPYGPGPKAALEEALALCADLGFPGKNYDNYVGCTDLNGEETQLHILGHLDVVPEGSGWDTDPYTCVEKDGMLYGRGVSDDKGPVVAALFAMKAIRDLGIPVSKNVRLILGTDEESGSSDIAYYYEREPFAPMSFTPDANFPLINVEKGHFSPHFGRQWPEEAVLPRLSTLTGGFRRNVVPPEAEALVLGLSRAQAEPVCKAVEEETGARFTLSGGEEGLVIHCSGKNAHAAQPEDGINAIQAILEVLVALPLAECESTGTIKAMHTLFPFGDTRGKGLGIAMADEVSGETTVNLALIDWNETGFSADIDSRTAVCANEENCLKACEATLGQYGIGYLKEPRMMEAHLVEAGSPLVRTLLECYSAYTGEKDPQPIAIGGGTYVHHIPGGVAFGCEFPGFDPKMHSANEQARVDQLLTSAKIFALAIARLCA